MMNMMQTILRRQTKRQPAASGSMKRAQCSARARRVSFSVAWLALVAVGSACGGSAQDESRSANEGSELECAKGDCTESLTYADLVHAICETERSCCAMQGASLAPLMDCETSYENQTRAGKLLRKGTVTIDRAFMSASLAALREAAQTCEWPLKSAANPFLGSVGEGGACEDATECESARQVATHCVSTSSGEGALGVCRAALRGKLGDACDESCGAEGDCSSNYSGRASDAALTSCYAQDALFCAGAGGSPGTCAPLIALDALCTYDDECATSSCAQGVCKPRTAEPVASDKVCLEGDPT